MASTQRVATREGPNVDGARGDYRVVEPVEQYLEYLRWTDQLAQHDQELRQGLALWWTFLEQRAGVGCRRRDRTGHLRRAVQAQ